MDPEPRTRQAQAERRDRLIEQFGKPEQVDPEYAFKLALLSHARSTLSDWVYGARVTSKENAEGWARANFESYGHPLLGIYPEIGGTWVYVLDLKPSIEAMREESRQLEEAHGDQPEDEPRCG